jgi:disulfide bond formation protein DsbB
MTPSLARNINILGALGISSVLLGAYGFQFILWEFPCPLCLLIRMGMLGVAFGFLLNLKFGIRPSHYGVSIISAMFGGAVALRQVLLHIVPGTGSYGSPVFGMHLYTWAFVIFAAAVLIIGILLVFDRQFSIKETEEPALSGFAKFIFILVIGIALANVVTAFLECGFGPCPDNPTQYELLK